jgi:hypothetical protein
VIYAIEKVTGQTVYVIDAPLSAGDLTQLITD